MSIIHVKSDTAADFTGTFTGFNSQGSTSTYAATDLVRPSDWNSAHNFAQTISGNTAGASSTFSGTNLVFAGTNGLTLNASTAASAATIYFDPGNPLTSQSNQAFSAQGGSSAFQTLSFSNANGLTFSNNAGQVVGSYTVPTVTNSSWTVSDVATSATVGRLAFTNSNGLTLSLSTSNNGNHTVIGSYTVPTITNSSWTVSDAATSGTVGRLAFTNLNGVTLSLSTGAAGSHTIVGSHNALTSQSNQAFSASGGSSAFQTLNFANSNGLTFTNTNGSVAASYTVPTVTQYFSNTATTFNGTNISGSLTHNTAGLRIDLSVAAPGGGGNLTAYATSNTTQSSTGVLSTNSLIFAGAGIASVGISNGSVVVSVPTGGGAGDGYNIVSMATDTAGGGSTSGATYSTLSGSIGLYAGTAMLLSQTSNSIYIHNPQVTASTFQNRQYGASSTVIPGQNSLWLMPFRLGNYLSASTFQGQWSFNGTATSNQTNTVGATIIYGLWQQTATDPSSASRFDSVWSASEVYTWFEGGTTAFSYNYSNNATSTSNQSASSALMSQYTGLRLMTNSIGSTLGPGLYLGGFAVSTSSAGGSSVMRSIAAVMDSPEQAGYGQGIGGGTNGSIGFIDGGTYSATTGGIPASIHLTQIGPRSNQAIVFKIGAY